MLKNWIKIAVRDVIRHKGYALIKIFGLSVGIACCLLIFLWVQNERSYDTFHKNSDNLYRVVQHLQYKDGPFPIAKTPEATGKDLVADFPELIDYARLMTLNSVLIRYNDKKIYEEGCILADPSLFTIMSFKLKSGNPKSLFNELNTIAITEKMAKKYFGNENPLGKVIGINRGDYTVTGIIEDLPANSHLQFDFVINFEVLFKKFGLKRGWNNNEYYTYVLAENNINITDLNSKLSTYMQKFEPGDQTKLELQPLKDIHLKSSFAIDLGGHSENKETYVIFFSIIALGILLIACINYINLTTARATTRAKEIGIRKVNGANKASISKQFFTETIVSTMISLIIAILLVLILLPVFNNITNRELIFNPISNLQLLLSLVGITLLTGLVSGIYPAVLLSSFKPVLVLKSTEKNIIKGNSFRRVLVVAQFTISIVLIVGTIVVFQQLNFMMSKELGYEKSHLVYFRKTPGIRSNYESFKSELLKNPKIKNITSTSDIPTHTVHATVGFNWEGKLPTDKAMIHWHSVDPDYMATMGIKIEEGRDFSKDFSADLQGKSFIINDEAAKMMGMENPVGKQFEFWGNKGTIIGLLKGFHFKSLHAKIEPLVLWVSPQWQGYAIARIDSRNISKNLGFLEETYNKYENTYPINTAFVDTEVDKLYGNEERTRKVFFAFTIIAILISCIGLFSLMAYVAEKKTKEIGIRKVLGASVHRLLSFLSRETLMLIFISNSIAWPIAYYLMNQWLQEFAYKSALSIWYFILAGILGFIIALVTTGYHIIRVAYTNPIDSLRDE